MREAQGDAGGGHAERRPQVPGRSGPRVGSGTVTSERVCTGYTLSGALATERTRAHPREAAVHNPESITRRLWGTEAPDEGQRVDSEQDLGSDDATTYWLQWVS